MVSLVITGIGNTAGAVMVTRSGGFGVSSRTPPVVPPGTVIKHSEGPPVTKHREKKDDSYHSGGLPHHTEKGTGLKRKRSVKSPVAPGTRAGSPGTGIPIQTNGTVMVAQDPPDLELVYAVPMSSGNDHIRVIATGGSAAISRAVSAASGGTQCTVKALQATAFPTVTIHAAPVSATASGYTIVTFVVAKSTRQSVPDLQVVSGVVIGAITKSVT